MDKQHGNHGHHLVSIGLYWRVFGGLIALTVLTVLTSYINFGGGWNILIAMGIATAKALLVVMFFMGLKYDSQENNVTFFSAFVFLAIFVGLTSADLFYRESPSPVKVDASELAQSGEPVDVNAFIKPTPELVSKGQALYTQNCLSCHGAEGKGDGPAAAALNPKPRNFSASEGWKNGRTVSQVFKTLTEGLPGTPMPPFSGLPPADRFALTHYVRSLGASMPEDVPGAVETLKKQLGGPAKPRLSIDEALEKVAAEWQAAHGNK